MPAAGSRVHSIFTDACKTSWRPWPLRGDLALAFAMGNPGDDYAHANPPLDTRDELYGQVACLLEQLEPRTTLGLGTTMKLVWHSLAFYMMTCHHWRSRSQALFNS